MISLIACIDKNGALGDKEGNLLYHLPNDLKRFKQLTENNVVVMGRITYESIVNKLGKPLPNRTNIVITSNREYVVPYDNVYTYPSLRDVILEYENYWINDNEELFIIGGGQIYEQTISKADRIYLTIVDDEYNRSKVGAYFPVSELKEWKEILQIKCKKDEKHSHDYSFRVLEKL